MKLRISNRKDFSVEFLACSDNEFCDSVKQAAVEFREHEYRSVHRGEIGKTVIWANSGYLGVFDELSGNWYNPGQIKQTVTGLAFFEPREIQVLPFRESDTLESVLLQDEFSVNATYAQIWSMCVDVWKWGLALNNCVQETMYMLDEEDDRLDEEDDRDD